MTQATDSQFSMLRGAVALAWADGRITPQEKDRLLDFVNGNASLSDAQRSTIKNDMEHKLPLAEIWPQITDKMDRARLIDLAQDIFIQDKTYSDQEKTAYKHIYDTHIASLDHAGIETELRLLRESREQRDAADDNSYQGSDTIIGKFGRLIWSLEKKLGL